MPPAQSGAVRSARADMKAEMEPALSRGPGEVRKGSEGAEGRSVQPIRVEGIINEEGRMDTVPKGLGMSVTSQPDEMCFSQIARS